MANYECSESSVTFINDMAHSIMEKQNTFPTTLLTNVCLGRIVKEMFGGRVSMTRRGSRNNKKRAYLNLARKSKETAANVRFTQLEDAMKTVHLPLGWYRAEKSPKEALFFRLEDWEFNGIKVILELTLKQVTPAGDIVIVLKSHGCQLDAKEVLNIRGETVPLMSLKQQVELLLDLFDKSSTCRGIPLEGKHLMAMVPHVTGTYRFLREESDESLECRAFSQSCKIIVNSDNKPCTSCAYITKINNARIKRKQTQTSVHPFCNKRYLNKDEVIIY